jgi:hypothetical protein
MSSGPNDSSWGFLLKSRNHVSLVYQSFSHTLQVLSRVIRRASSAYSRLHLRGDNPAIFDKTRIFLQI